jgi:hypothetical protein
MSTDDGKPRGQRFTHVHVEPPSTRSDSARMRLRIYRLFKALSLEDAQYKVYDLLERELGVEVPVGGYGILYRRFFESVEINDVLDSITLIAKMLRQGNRLGRQAVEWQTGVERIFREESMQYVLDELGGVHLHVDTAFQRTINATIAGLGDSRFAGARDCFEQAIAALDSNPTSGKNAIRQVFGACEIVFKLLITKADKLTKDHVRRYLPTIVGSSLTYDDTARRSLYKCVNSFEQWVDAAHFYRHEQGEHDPVEPPIDVAILTVSQGASWLRWLAGLYLDSNQKSAELNSPSSSDQQ